MAAKLSASSACFMRGRLPCGSRSPARWATPMSVPALSNTSTMRKLKTMMMNVSSAAREKSSWRKVGASEGGAEMMPVNSARPSGIPRSVTAMMPSSVAPTLAVIEGNDHDETQKAEKRRPLLEIAEGHQRRGICHHDLGFLQRDDAEKEADAGGDRQFQILRDRIDDVFADVEDRDQEEDHAGTEHAGERLLPAVFVLEHHGEGEERIEPHARCERDRIIGVERHHQGRDGSRDAGRDENRALVHSGTGKDLRVDEHDVDHGEKGRDAGDQFRAHVAAALAQAKIAI